MNKSKFVMWGCGHAHQEGEDGRVEMDRSVCHPQWYLLEVANPKPATYSIWHGLKVGQYTLHTRSADGTFSPATTVKGYEDAVEYATSQGRCLMIKNDDGDRWIKAQ